MAKREKKDFVASVQNKHFKLDKATKRLLALASWPSMPKLNANEQAEAQVQLAPLSQNEFKKMMVKAQLSDVDAKLTGMDDPLWKPKKEENEEGAESGNSASSKKSRKGKKQPKMRKEEVATTNDNAN